MIGSASGAISTVSGERIDITTGLVARSAGTVIGGLAGFLAIAVLDGITAKQTGIL